MVLSPIFFSAVNTTNSQSYAENYRFGFNGQEKDNEIKGIGNSLSFKYRIYANRLGRFLSVDPITSKYPWNSPYAFAENDVVRCVDLEGLGKWVVTARAFIPFYSIESPWAGNPFNPIERFRGDNRKYYSVNSTRFRSSQKVKVDFDSKSVSVLQNRLSRVRGCDENDKIIRMSPNGKRTPGPRPKYAKAKLDKTNSTTIYIEINAVNDLITFPPAPAINYKFSLDLTENEDGTVDYSLKGNTDGYPAYEFWLTNVETGESFLIMNSNPIESKETPYALPDPMEKAYEVEGNTGDLDAQDKVDFSDKNNTPLSSGG